MVFIEYCDKKIASALFKGEPVITAIEKIAKQYPDQTLLISKKGTETAAFIEAIGDMMNPFTIISSFTRLHDDLGYVEDGPFIAVSDVVKYPTWTKSASIFTIHATLVNQVAGQLSHKTSLLYWINSLSKLARPLGILCYQVPLALEQDSFTTLDLYRFVKQHYKTRWIIILLLCHFWYEKRFPVYAFAKALFHKNRHVKIDVFTLQLHRINNHHLQKDDLRYDVIIPTMGRASYLYDVLKDLSKQNIKPAKVIIIEQNADESSITELSYLQQDKWPFEIEHEFIHVTGACNARNLALTKTTAPWILFFDDDVRLTKDFINKVANMLHDTKSKVMTFACLQKGEKESMQAFKQWESFGSGCSMVHKDIVEQCTFDMALEHGYGEDVDYGMQIRNAGYDVIYAPQIQMLHLKAAVGGFREPYIFPWHQEIVIPKPSPQITYHRKKNYTYKQLLGYKMIQFFKTYGSLGTKNPWKHYKNYLQAWKQSEKWASQL